MACHPRTREPTTSKKQSEKLPIQVRTLASPLVKAAESRSSEQSLVCHGLHNSHKRLISIARPDPQEIEVHTTSYYKSRVLAPVASESHKLGPQGK